MYDGHQGDRAAQLEVSARDAAFWHAAKVAAATAKAEHTLLEAAVLELYTAGHFAKAG